MRLAPWAARALANPRPMPLVDPVTRAVLPFSMKFLRKWVMASGIELGCSGCAGWHVYDEGLSILVPDFSKLFISSCLIQVLITYFARMQRMAIAWPFGNGATRMPGTCWCVC